MIELDFNKYQLTSADITMQHIGQDSNTGEWIYDYYFTLNSLLEIVSVYCNDAQIQLISSSSSSSIEETGEFKKYYISEENYKKYLYNNNNDIVSIEVNNTSPSKEYSVKKVSVAKHIVYDCYDENNLIQLEKCYLPKNNSQLNNIYVEYYKDKPTYPFYNFNWISVQLNKNDSNEPLINIKKKVTVVENSNSVYNKEKGYLYGYVSLDENNISYSSSPIKIWKKDIINTIFNETFLIEFNLANLPSSDISAINVFFNNNTENYLVFNCRYAFDLNQSDDIPYWSANFSFSHQIYRNTPPSKPESIEVSFTD